MVEAGAAATDTAGGHVAVPDSLAAVPAPDGRATGRRLAAIAIAVGFVLLASAGGFQIYLSDAGRAATTSMREARAVHDALVEVADRLQDAESAQRGYLITGDPGELAAFAQAQGALPDGIATLRRRVGGRPEEAALLDQVEAAAAERMADLARGIALEQSGRHDAARALVTPGADRRRAEVTRAAAALDTMVAQGGRSIMRLQDATSDRLRGAGIAAIVLAILLGGLLVRETAGHFATLRRREEALRALAGMLERHVAQRTAALTEINRRFDTALRASLVTVFTQDRALRYTWLSAPVNGRSPAEVAGLTDAELLPADAAARIVAVKREVLATGRPARLELLLDRGTTQRWYDVTMEALPAADGAAGGIIGAAADITERQQREAHVRLLMHELTHRSKNLLTVILAIARQTARGASGIDDFLARFNARLDALAGAQDLLVREDWQGAGLADLARSQLGHYADLVGSQIVLDGDEVRLSAEAAQHVGMALHELATNAAKYGALSTPAGVVRIAWSVAGDAVAGRVCTLSWTESGGPPVAAPERRGFGQVVLERSAAQALGGEVALDFDPAGVRWRLVFPLAVPPA